MEKKQRENEEKESGWERETQKKKKKRDSSVTEKQRKWYSATDKEKHTEKVRKTGGESAADREMYSWERSTAIPCGKGAMKQQLPEGQEQRGHM